MITMNPSLINKKHSASSLLLQVIRPTLSSLNFLAFSHGALWSTKAEELLLGIACHESFLYKRKQDQGPALGLWQMEEPAFNITAKFLKEKASNFPTFEFKEIRINDFVACFYARTYIFAAVAELIPECGELEAQAHYWKKYWNTEKGKGTVEQYINHYRELVFNERL